MAARLSVRNAATGHRYTVFVDAAPLLIGRARTADIRLPFSVVSSRHLRLGRDEDGYWTIEELGSTNGTHLNGELLVQGPARVLSSGDELTIGEVAVSFIDDAQQNSGDFTLAQTGTLARKLVADALSFESNDETAFIEVIGGPASGKRTLISDGVDELVIGSRNDAWLTLDGLEDEEIQIKRSGDGFAFERLDDETEPRELRSKDRIELGVHTLVFFDPLEALLDQKSASASATVASDPVDPSTHEGESPPHEAPQKKGRAFGATEIGLIVFAALLFVGGIAVMLVIFGVL